MSYSEGLCSASETLGLEDNDPTFNLEDLGSVGNRWVAAGLGCGLGRRQRELARRWCGLGKSVSYRTGVLGQRQLG